MANRKELYADIQNYRAVQIEAAMNGKQPPTKAQWEKEQKAKKK